MTYLRKFGTFSLCLVILTVSLGATTASAQSGRMSCSSVGDGYNYCRVETDNRVRLVRQMSSRYCDQGSSWGYDRHGIWVDRGCRAEFEYGKGISGTGAAIGGAVAGGILLAAIIAANRHKNDKKDNDGYNGENSYELKKSTPPNWMIGTFRGYSRNDGNVEITIYDDGRVWSGKNGSSGTFYKGEININGQTYKTNRVFNGFEAAQTTGYNSDVITFSRIY